MLDLFTLETSEGGGDGGATGDISDVSDVSDAGAAPDDLDAVAADLDADAAADGGDDASRQPAEPDFGSIFGRPEFQQALGQAVQDGLVGLMNIPPPDAGPADEPINLDDLDPISDPAGYMETMLRANAQLFQQMLDERLGPYEPGLARSAEDGWKAETEQYYAGIEKEVGAFDHDIARSVAAGLDTLSGGGERDPHGAAARQLAAHDKQVAERAVEAYKQSLTRDSTPYEPGVGGSGTPGDGKPKDELEAARMWVGRREASRI